MWISGNTVAVLKASGAPSCSVFDVGLARALDQRERLQGVKRAG